MARKIYRPVTELIGPATNGGELPINHPIAVYYRQSTDGQVGNISTSIQTIDMVTYLQERGWKEKDIVLIDMDAGVSGTKKIDERPGMKRVFELITGRVIRAVACQDEDRLFRDITQIQVNIFIEACRAANVLVITPTMVYDFANEFVGTFHARQFRFKCEMAAEYINTVILGKLTRAKRRMIREGRWAGSFVPVGYMVDNRKRLPDGSENPAWRKFVPFEPYAEVILAYFQLFSSYNGNLRATARHIYKHGPFYPDLASCPPPDGYTIKYRLRIYGGGFAPSRTGLADLLINAVYLGHWTTSGGVAIRNNHPPLVTEDLFMQAFNRLSPVGLDGHRNKHFDARHDHMRPSLEEERPVERPLLLGMLVAENESTWHNVGSEYTKRDRTYRYVFRRHDVIRSIAWTRASKAVDAVIVDLLHDKLKVTFDADLWEQSVAHAMKKYSDEHKGIRAQLASLKQVMERQILSLEQLTHPEMVKTVEARYADAEAEYKRLNEMLVQIEDEKAQMRLFADLKRDFGTVLENWNTYSRARKRNILMSFIDQIQTRPTDEGGLDLNVVWKDGNTDILSIRRQTAKGIAWLPSETGNLLAMANGGATQIEIARMFPERTWETISKHLYSAAGGKYYALRMLPIRPTETYADYQARMAQSPLPYKSRGEHWLAEDDTRLISLVESNVGRVDIAAKFPHRTWRSIQERIRQLCGKGTVIGGRGTIRSSETYEMHQLRTVGKSDYARLHADAMTIASRSSPYHRARQASAACGLRSQRPAPVQSAARSGAYSWRECCRRQQQ